MVAGSVYTGVDFCKRLCGVICYQEVFSNQSLLEISFFFFYLFAVSS